MRELPRKTWLGWYYLSKYLKEAGASPWRPGGRAFQTDEVGGAMELHQENSWHPGNKWGDTREPQNKPRVPWGPQPEHPHILTQMLPLYLSNLPSASVSTNVFLQLHSVLWLSRFRSISDGDGASSSNSGRRGGLLLRHALIHVVIAYSRVKGTEDTWSTNMHPFTGALGGRFSLIPVSVFFRYFYMC